LPAGHGHRPGPADARLGFARFRLASHDRGRHVAHRLALDHPGVVTRLAVLDIGTGSSWPTGMASPSTCSPAEPGYGPLSVWQQYTPDVRANAPPVGHFLPEEAPDLVTAALRDFSD
jgi:pimeloyl-ACP methyl ester carboxylesterase